MSTKKIAEFPNVEAKLQKPTKQSAFERKRAEAEAKRQREAAETAAVYEDFIKSFDHDGDTTGTSDSRLAESRFGSGPPDRPAGLGPQAPFGGGAGKRHFGIPSGSSMKSGPGSLGPPPSSLGKKRFYDGTPAGYQRDRDEAGRRFGFEDQGSGYKSISKVFDASDDEGEPTAVDRAEEKAISRPTLRLANLPPTTSPAVVKALMPPNLTVENVKIVPPSGPSGTERKSTAAIVTLSKETPATDIDAAVSSLQNHYLGFGFYLSLHRHLSSAAISSSSLATITSSSAAVLHPFGAKRAATPTAKPQGPQPMGYGRGFAPPSSYGPPAGGGVNRSGILHVPIQPPKDIKKLRMIHKVIEAVLEHGPDFEALLMSRPDVQREERWAWIWDARSEGGIWYRWRLWEIVTGIQSKRGQGKYLPLFEGSHAWKIPEQPLSYEYTTGIDEIISDSEYNSSDEDEFEDEQNRQAEGPGANHDQEDVFLNPIEKSRMAHLLARLPTTLSKARKGDIARVTTFALTHASKGSDEITEMIVSNIERPFAFTSANPDHKQESKAKVSYDRDSHEPSPAQDDKAAAHDTQDTSPARLVALYVVSDILSSSSTSGIRHAWRYRQLLEGALRRHKTFENLGMMAEKYNWGRLRAEKWKRSIGLVLSLWEGWCVFPAETHEFFVDSFENPPGLKKEKSDETQKKAGRWKTVEASSAEKVTESKFLPVSQKPPSRQSSPAASGDGERLQETLETGDTDGEINYSYGVGSDSDSDEPLFECDIDGEPIGGSVEGPTDGDAVMGAMNGAPTLPTTKVTAMGAFQISASKSAPSRKRVRAVDMFADSGSEDGE